MNAAAAPQALLDFDAWGHALAQRHRAVLTREVSGIYHLLAETEPAALLLQAVRARVRAPVSWQPCDAATLDACLLAGGQGFRALDGVQAITGDSADGEAVHELSSMHIAGQASPAVQLLDAVLHDALLDGASDVHLETDGRGAQVRLRIDGVMQALRRIDGVALAEQMVSRLKVMAVLDIGERRLPQDGRFKLRVAGRDIDFRLSVQVKLVKNEGNSGIQFRSIELADGEMKGDQADIGPGWWGKLYEENGRGLLVGLVDPIAEVVEGSHHSACGLARREELLDTRAVLGGKLAVGVGHQVEHVLSREAHASPRLELSGSRDSWSAASAWSTATLPAVPCTPICSV